MQLAGRGGGKEEAKEEEEEERMKLPESEKNVGRAPKNFALPPPHAAHRSSPPVATRRIAPENGEGKEKVEREEGQDDEDDEFCFFLLVIIHT